MVRPLQTSWTNPRHRSMNKPSARKGTARRCSGFTKARFWRVSLASGAFLAAGILIAAYSIMAPEASAYRLLLFAACCLLVACAMSLFSIMALLFYLGRDEQSEEAKTAAEPESGT